MPAVRFKRYPRTGPLSTIEGWQKADVWLKGWQDDGEKRHYRWLAIQWIWYESLLRAELNEEEQKRFSPYLSRARKRVHDYFIGGKPLSDVLLLGGIPPHVSEGASVHEFFPDLPFELEPNFRFLCIDVTQPNKVLIPEIEKWIKTARAQQTGKGNTGSGKHYSLARLVEVLWMYDRKRTDKVKWDAVIVESITFPKTKHTATNAANLLSEMLTTAKKGPEQFLHVFC